MFFRVNGVSLVVGMDWHVSIEGSISKAVKSKNSKWYWSSPSSINFGTLRKADSVEKKDLPLHSAVIALSLAFSDQNVFAAIRLGDDETDSQKFAVFAIFEGKPHDDFDIVVSDPAQVSKLISDFGAMCEHGSFTLVGNLQHPEIVYFDFDILADAVSDYSQIKKLRSDLLNQITIPVLIAGVAYGGFVGWSEYKKYRAAKIAERMAANQKTAQQQYDEAILAKRAEYVLLASEGPSVLSKVTSLPSEIGGWNLTSGKCTPTNEKVVACSLTFSKPNSSDVDHHSFVKDAPKLNLTDITYKPDFKTITANLRLTDLKFSTYGTVLDTAETVEKTWIDFGSSLQKFFPFAAPGITDYKPFAVPPGVDINQISKPQQFADWKQSGPIKIFEMFSDFPKYSTISNFNFDVGANSQYRFNHSFLTVEVTGSVFAKAF